MAEATFTFRVDDELKVRLTEAAKARDRTGAQLLRDFMRVYVKHQEEEAAYDAWFRREVEAGIASANAGHLIPAEELEAEFTARRAAMLRKLSDGRAQS
ncbi:MAG TPA: antitoxin of toxin-antitoxin stability system [Stellaceae bacterium]|nr:antitoxin of toxin-antitoxin stability system [Stellaceae bacterium]